LAKFVETSGAKMVLPVCVGVLDGDTRERSGKLFAAKSFFEMQKHVFSFLVYRKCKISKAV
jgi:hypothetical protein